MEKMSDLIIKLQQELEKSKLISKVADNVSQEAMQQVQETIDQLNKEHEERMGEMKQEFLLKQAEQDKDLKAKQHLIDTLSAKLESLQLGNTFLENQKLDLLNLIEKLSVRHE